MKRSTLRIVFPAVWLASMAVAFFVGKNLQSPDTPSVAEIPELQSSGRTDTPGAGSGSGRSAAAPVSGTAESDLQGDALMAELLGGEGSTLTLSAALSEVRRLTPAETSRMLDAAFALPQSDPRRLRVLSALLEQLAESAPEEALRLAGEIGSLRHSERARRDILEVWGRNDPVAALNWAQTALVDEPSNLRQSQMEAILRGYAETNPQAAFQYASALDESTESARREKRQMLSEVIEAQIQNGGLNDAKLAVELMEDGPVKESALRELVDEWASFDPENAAAYVTSLGADAPDYLKRTLVSEWAESDPAGAAAWLSTLPDDDPTVARATAEIIREWTRYDLNASAEWLNTLPASPELDRAVASYTYRAAQEDPLNAMGWAESISDDRMRTRMMERVAASWKSEDPETFEEYLDGSEFSEEEKEALANANEGRGWRRWR